MPASSASLGRVMSTGLAVEQDLAAGLGIGAVDQPRQLGAAGADQPGDAQHLALRAAGSWQGLTRRPPSVMPLTSRITGPRLPCGSCSFL